MLPLELSLGRGVPPKGQVYPHDSKGHPLGQQLGHEQILTSIILTPLVFPSFLERFQAIKAHPKYDTRFPDKIADNDQIRLLVAVVVFYSVSLPILPIMSIVYF